MPKMLAEQRLLAKNLFAFVLSGETKDVNYVLYFRHSSEGQSLLVLLPSEEEGMLRQLRIHKIPIDKIQVDPKKMVDMQRKIEAHLASDSELKASAQRAFLAYIKSTYLLKNKEIFDVTKLDTDKFAHSLGLAVPPRIRFLQRLNKKTTKLDESDEDESDEESDLLTVKRKDHQIEESEDQDEPLENITDSQSKVKVVTKASIAKKILKKNFKANQKIVFDEEGQGQNTEDASLKKSKEGQEYDQDESGGIDLIKAKQILKAEDKFDKELAKDKRKAKKRELKEAAKQKRNATQNQVRSNMNQLCTNFWSKYGPKIDRMWTKYEPIIDQIWTKRSLKMAF